MLDERVKSGNQRNTRKWCKGKVGILHNYQPTVTESLLREGHLFETKWLACSCCGRRKDYLGFTVDGMEPDKFQELANAS